jgi:hypothetical protein
LLNTVLGTLSSGVAASTSSYESIATANGTGSSATITFSSIPSTYKHLQIRGISRDTSGSGDTTTLIIRYNSTAGTSYATHRLWGNGANAYASGNANYDGFYLGNLTTQGGAVASNHGAVIVDIIDYASTTKYKTSRALGGASGDNSAYDIDLTSYVFMSTSAITTIELICPSGSNYTTTTTFALYGIKG